MKTTLVFDTPIFWLEPNATQTRKLIIWLHGFTESREDVTDKLRDLASVANLWAVILLWRRRG